MAQTLVWNAGITQIDLSMYSYDISVDRRIVGGDGQVFRAQVVIDEDSSDDMLITEHPVSGAAMVHDHAVKRPAEVRVRMGWSNAYLAAQQPGAIGVGGGVKQLYEQILQLQASRLLSTIYTGKRQYNNMLIASLRTHTDQTMEYSFIADITFRELVLTSTAAFGLGQSFNQGALANPDSNTQQVNGGTYQLLPANVQASFIPPSNASDLAGQAIG